MAILREDDDEGVTKSNEETVDVNDKDSNVEVVEDTGQDERIAQNEEGDDDQQEERQERRPRETAAERRARAKRAKEQDKREIDFQKRELDRLQKQLDALNHNQTVSRVTNLDERISTALNEVSQMERVHAAAITKANGEDATAAMKLRNEAENRARQLQWEKQQLIEQANTPRQAPVPYLDKAQAFMAANPWYTHNGADSDSKLVQEIDAAVAKEYIPTSDAYWKELQRRVDLNLPKRAKRDDRRQEVDDDVDDDTPTRKGPPVGGSSRSVSSSQSGTQIRLSPERVNAMKEAGLWDNPKTRLKMAKKYAEYDKNNRS